MTRPLQATIDLSALRHNFGVARRHARGARLWAVVKANAYGHGLMRTAHALADCADGFAVIELDGAIALREAGLQQPILLLEGFYTADELPAFAEYRLTPVLHSLDQVEAIIQAGLPSRLPVYLKLNTGMNRLGLNADEFRAALTALQASPQIGAITLMTHFANADADIARMPEAIAAPQEKFAALRRQTLHSSGLPQSLANSAALLRFPESIGREQDWARPGIMLYGSSPFPEQQSAEALGLRPVMTLSSALIAVRDIGPGDSVGYGGDFTATAPMRIGVVACGYADGYPRHAPTGTPVLVEGRRTRLIGRVSMDKICVDLGDITDAACGSPVVLWGEGLSVDEVASAAGTISYELFSALAARVSVRETDLPNG
jgi:alanine racemase